ncbi:MAG: response regulator transcription factor [Sarcina sp.]
MKQKILVVEDDLKIQDLICEFLSTQNYDVDCASDGVEGYEKFNEEEYDLVILDVMMPKLDGHGLCSLIRSKNKNVAIIFLTALGEESDELKAFDLDADDYIIKPFSFNVLIKRVKVALKRSVAINEDKENMVFEDLRLNLNTFKGYFKEEELDLTLKEFNILKLLMEMYPSVVSRDILLDKVWGYDYFGDTRVIDTHIKNIRKKIDYQYLSTVKGIGYVLEK